MQQPTNRAPCSLANHYAALPVCETQIWSCLQTATTAYGENVRKASGQPYIVHPHLTPYVAVTLPQSKSFALKDAPSDG